MCNFTFLLEIIIINRSIKTRLLLRDKYKVVHSDRLYRPSISRKTLSVHIMHVTCKFIYYNLPYA